MASDKCPLCESPCIIKIISTGDARYCEVDVCKICGTMYPRGKKAGAAKATKKPAKKPAKKARKK
jgi:hypothetical protein